MTNPDITISPTSPADLPGLIRLWNDGRVMKWVHYPEGLGYTPEKAEEWFQRLEANPDSHHYVIRTGELGFCGELFYRRQPAHRRASLDIKLVPESQGQGIAAQALQRLIRMVFESEPEIVEVYTEPNDGNEKAMALYARCGLQPGPRPDDLGPADSYWALRRETWQKNN